MTIRRLTLALLLLSLPWRALAQTAPLTGVLVNIYRQGSTAAAVAPVTIPIAAVFCDQPSTPASGASVNPTIMLWEDPAAPTRDCRWTDTGTGILSMLAADPAVIYQGTIALVNAVGTGPESARSNLFTRPGLAPAAAPARLRFVRP